MAIELTDNWIVATDSTAATVALCRETDAPRALTEHISREDIVGYAAGVIPRERPLLPGYDSGIVGLLLLTILFVAVSFRQTSGYMKTLFHDLFSVRRRTNVFDDRTVTETRLTVALGVMACVCEGVLIYLSPWYSPSLSGLGAFEQVAGLSVLAIAYYLFGLVGYTVVGIVFGSKSQYSRWIKGFTASQGMLGILLLLPAMWVLFNPADGMLAAATGGALYLLARLVFICKGFRIFYKNSYSLIYFILYLCTLEIVPVCWVIKLSAELSELQGMI